MSLPSRGEVWWVDLEPTQGDEQRSRKGPRPCLVISVDEHNSMTRSPLDTVLAAPLSSTIRSDIPWHIGFNAEELGMNKDGAVLCDQIRSLARERFEEKEGEVHPDSPVMRLVLDRLMVLTGYYEADPVG